MRALLQSFPFRAIEYTSRSSFDAELSEEQSE